MRTPYAVAFILTLLIAGTYMYSAVEAVCKVPLSYRIGSIDNRFDISQDEARVAIADAESIWEQATGRNLFTYADDGELVINFVFDDRQQFAEAEVDLREQLEEAEGANDEISDTYVDLLAQYDDLEAQYQLRLAAYEQRLASYNETVESYNEEGGAPPDVYEELEAENSAIKTELQSINSLGRQLNGLAGRINELGDRGNELIENYNENVGRYNETFGEPREFTQGEYSDGNISIYKFIDEKELTLVLAHELGHALSLGHIENEASIMYHLMGGQPLDLALSEADLDEFERVCGRSARSWIERLFIWYGV